MTKLLYRNYNYNLYKQNFVNQEREKTRVINSNRQIEEKMRDVLRIQRMEMPEGSDPDGFRAGLLAEEIEVPEEPQISLEEIQAQADEMIAQARQQADEILENAETQKEEWRQQARTQGYEEGQAKAQTEAEQFIRKEQQKLEEKGKELEQQYQKKYEELEPLLLENVLTVLEEVFHTKIEDQSDVVLGMVEEVVGDTENAKEFRIRVSSSNCVFLQAHVDEIKAKTGLNSMIEFVPDQSMNDSKCVIETDSGIVDCSLDVQLNNLIQELKSLCGLG